MKGAYKRIQESACYFDTESHSVQEKRTEQYWLSNEKGEAYIDQYLSSRWAYKLEKLKFDCEIVTNDDCEGREREYKHKDADRKPWDEMSDTEDVLSL